MSYLRGKLYNLEKQQGRRNDITLGQSGTKLDEENLTCDHFDHKLEKKIAEKTAQRLAERYKVGSGTIRRDAKFADAVDNLADAVGEDVRESILSRDANLTKKETLELGAIALNEPEQVKEKFEGGRYLKEKQLTPFPYKVGEVVNRFAQSQKAKVKSQK